MRRLLAEAPPDAINLSLGQPDFRLPRALQIAATKALIRTPYTENSGRRDLRELIAERMGVGADDVVVTCGSAEALAAWTLVGVERGKTVLVPDPGYPAYAALCKLVEARAEPYALRPDKGWQPSGEALAQRMDRGDVGGLVINSPSNPCSVVLPAATFRPALEIARKRGIPVLSDEAYGELVFGGVFENPVEGFADVATRCGSLSKTHSAMGLRLGWMTVPEAWREPAMGVHQFLTTCAPWSSQAAAVAAFRGLAQAELRASRRLLESKLEKVMSTVEALPGWTVPVRPDAGFYLFVDVRETCGEDDLSYCRNLAQEAHVVLAPGTGFGPGGRGYIRINYAVQDALLDDALRRLKKFVEVGQA
jgi:aspartate/methionine/tyrosine aminotransferase